MSTLVGQDVAPPSPVGGGRRRQPILASGEESSCSCGTWYCCSKGIREMQEFTERFYWSNPVFSSPPIPPVPLIQRPWNSGDENEEEETSGETEETVGNVLEVKECNRPNENEDEGKTADCPIDKDVHGREGGGNNDGIGGENVEGIRGGDGVGNLEERNGGGESLEEVTDQQSNHSMEYFDCYLYDELPPDLENMMDFIQGPPPDAPPVLDVEMNEGSGESQLPDIQPEDEPFELHDLEEISSQPPSPIMEVTIEPPPILTPAFVLQSTPPPKLTVQKLINFVRNSPLYDQSSKTTAPPLPLPSSSHLPILEISSAPPQPQPIPVPSCSSQAPPQLIVGHFETVEISSPFGNPPALEVSPSTHENGNSLEGKGPCFCKICDRSYATQRSFDMHLWRHRNCKGCRAQFKISWVSKSSSSSSTPIDNYCETCASNLTKSPPPSLLNQSSENGHQDQEDDEDEENSSNEPSSRNVWCQICKKKFRHQKRFDAHVLLHTVETRLNFKCKHCENSYKCKAELTAHMRSLEENKKFQCSICDKWFRLKNHLDFHMGTHKTGEGEFTCVICKKSFGSQRGLRAHQRSKSVCYYKMQRMDNIHN